MAYVTRKHVRQAVEHISTNMRKLGLLAEDESIVLIPGSPSNGQPYRLHTSVSGRGGYGTTGLLPGGFDNGSFLGWSAREALRAAEIVNAGLLARIALRRAENGE